MATEAHPESDPVAEPVAEFDGSRASDALVHEVILEDVISAIGIRLEETRLHQNTARTRWIALCAIGGMFGWFLVMQYGALATPFAVGVLVFFMLWARGKIYRRLVIKRMAKYAEETARKGVLGRQELEITDGGLWIRNAYLAMFMGWGVFEQPYVQTDRFVLRFTTGHVHPVRQESVIAGDYAAFFSNLRDRLASTEEAAALPGDSAIESSDFDVNRTIRALPQRKSRGPQSIAAILAGLGITAFSEVVLSRYLSAWIPDTWSEFAWWMCYVPSVALPGILVAVLIAGAGTQADKECRCRKCGYVLRGLTLPRCTECGEPI